MPQPTVTISSDPLSLSDVIAVADGSPVELARDVLDLIARSRAVVDAAVDRGDAVYGVTTGVGHARNERLPAEALEELQPFLIEMHVGALGPPLPSRVVRAGMVARLNGFARGGSGVSPALARGLEAMLNHGIHPIVPRTGSVGCADLGQLALIGRAMLGRGPVEWHGDVVEAAEALRACGLPELRLRPKDGIAIISSNALTVGRAALLSETVAGLLDLGDLVAATAMEAIRANPSIIDPAVASARGSEGQIRTSERLRAAVAGSTRVDAATATSVQDPLSFRVVPQVHGACRDVLTAARRTAVDELNAPSDNPLVDVESGRILSNGNFDAMNLALAIESLNLALAHVGLLSERRLGHLFDDAVTELGILGDGDGSPTNDETPPLLAGLALRYPAAARYTRIRHLAQPVSLDVPVLDLSVEDHATNAAEALSNTEEIVHAVSDVLIVEGLVAHALIAMDQRGGHPGEGTRRLVQAIRDELAHLPPGTLPHETHERVTAALWPMTGATIPPFEPAI